MKRLRSWYLSRPKWQGIAIAVVALFVVVGIGSAISERLAYNSADFAEGKSVGGQIGGVYFSLSGDAISSQQVRDYCDEAAFPRIADGTVESRESFLDGCVQGFNEERP